MADTPKTHLLKRIDLPREEIQRLGNFSRATYFKILNGTRPLSELERLGLETLPKKKGRPKGS